MTLHELVASIALLVVIVAWSTAGAFVIVTAYGLGGYIGAGSAGFVFELATLIAAEAWRSV